MKSQELLSGLLVTGQSPIGRFLLENRLQSVSVFPSNASWRVTVKLHDWGEQSSATLFSHWTLMMYSLPKWKHNVTCWSPLHIMKPAHASRLCKCDAFQLWSAVTQHKSDWWDFICDASFTAELHSPPCQWVINGFKRTWWLGYQTAYCTENIDFLLWLTVSVCGDKD